ncbi:MAG: hypothetical protein AB7I50_19870, partial [Vicinamibacterales bacterium]
GAQAATPTARFPLRVMEGVLENAVQNGALAVSTEMRRISPDVALFSGPPKARGFRLEGYGLFFAVEVPALHRSLTWSVRTLSQANGDLSRALQAIRRIVQSQHDPRMKTELEQALRLVELQVGPSTPSSVGTQAAAIHADSQTSADTGASRAVPGVITDPSAAYTDAVQSALAEAMLDYGATLNLGDAEWLTVAARETGDTLLAGDLTETVTITLRVRAADLQAFKAGRLTRAEARARVDVREF